MIYLKQLADQKIKPAIGKKTMVKENYVTSDIVTTILDADKVGFKDVLDFARSIQYNNLEDLCLKLHTFVRKYIQYIEDPRGEQYVKLPAAVWKDKYADCKSFSLFIGSCLKALGIPYSYRFVSFGTNPIYTHVYVIAHGKSKDVIVDGVISGFNTEKKFTFKKDYKMPGLYRIEGIGKAASLNLPDNVDQLTDAQLEARIVRQRLAIEHDIVSGIQGIGSAKAASYRKSIKVMDAFIGALDDHDHDRMQTIINQVGPGVGKLSLKKLFNQAKKGVTKVVDKGKSVVTKGAKALVKVVTAPARLAAKGILEVTLPKIAPLFLYLFINDQKIIDKLPEKMRSTRKKVEKLSDVIVNAIGMKRNHFMGLVRNGIMKHYSKSPESVLAEILKTKGISGIGIGILPLVVGLMPLLEGLIKKLTSLFGAKGVEVPEQSEFDYQQHAQEIDDSTANDLSKSILSQPGAGTGSGSLVPGDGGKKVFGIC